MLKDCAGQPELIFIATGSEVELAVAAWDKLTAEGVKARVVSMPSTDAFDKQDAAYRESVLPKAVSARVAVEAGIADYWFKYVGLNGAIVGMTTFGEPAPAEQLFEEFGFTVDNVVAKGKRCCNGWYGVRADALTPTLSHRRGCNTKNGNPGLLFCCYLATRLFCMHYSSNM